MSKKKTVYPVRKMGKHCGYDEYEDGSIKIAPSHYQKIEGAVSQEMAVNALLSALIEQCKNLFGPIIENKNRFWEGVADDYSLDREKYDYVYHPDTRIISRKDKEQGVDEP